MNKLLFRTLFVILLLCSNTMVYAHDFEVDGIYYNILSEEDKTVEVTYKGTSYSEYSNEYTGSVVIPESVTISNTLTTVIETFDAWTSTNKTNSSTSQTSYTLNVEADKVLKFDWEVSSQTNYDWLVITLDGTEIVKQSGTQSGSYEKSFDTTGSHTLVVKYTKDSSLSRNNDEGKIYNVTLNDLVGVEDVELRVTSIGERAFFGCTGLTGVKIPSSVTNIGNYTFNGCSGLTSVTIPNSVTNIGNYTFNGCSGLTSITIPGSVTSIGNYTFNGCSGLTSITIGNSVISIGNYAFNGCSGLTSVTIPSSVTSIGDRAFYGCSGLKTIINLSNLTFTKGSSNYGYVAYYADKVINAPSGSIEGDFAFGIIDGVNTLTGYLGADSEVALPESYKGEDYVIGSNLFQNNTTITNVTIPSSVTKIGNYAFSGCNGLTSVTIPSSVTSIGNYTFNGCSGLTSITIPGSVTSIGNYTFNGCSGLTSITIGNSVINIGNYAFNGCSGLTSITIPGSVTSIGEKAFYGCSGLKTIINLSNLTFTKGSSNYGYVAYYADKVINAPSGSIEGDFAFGIIDGVNTLTGYLGADSEVTLPESYKGEDYVIGSNLFQNNTTITSVTIPSSVTSIGERAFLGCSGLTSVTIPGSVTSISNYAFYNCTSLTSITIPNSVTSIGDYVFSGCTSLKELRIEDGEGILSLGYNLYKSSGIGEALFHDCPLETLYLGRNLSYNTSGSYGYSPFYNNTTLKSVTIGDSVITIGERLFYGCCSLVSAIIGCNVAGIDEYAFASCSNLASITIPKSLTKVENYALRSCSALKEVYISDLAAWCNIEFGSIDSNPLALVDKFYLDGVEITNLVISDNVTTIKPYTFCGCKSITSVTIGDNVTSIGDSSFKGCTNLADVTIGNNVASIGDYSFMGCSSLATITIPNNVNNIGNFVFDDCTALASVIFEAGVNYIALGYNKFDSLLGEGLFYDCPLKTLYLGRNVRYNSAQSYGTSPFYKKGIVSLTIGSDVTFLGNNIFEGCKFLRDLRFEDGVSTLELGYNYYQFDDWGKGLFYDSPLRTLYLGRNLSYKAVYNYGLSPFYYKYDLESIVVGDSVTVLGDFLFWLAGVKNVTLGKNVKNIGREAFKGCGVDLILNYSDLDLYYDSYDSYIASNNDVKIITLDNPVFMGDYIFNVKDDNNVLARYLGKDSVLYLPDSFNGEEYIVGNNSFYSCSTITDVVIPAKVTGIGGNAFKDCTLLENITIGSGVTYLGYDVFTNCSKLTSIVLPEKVTRIGFNTFKNCTSLENITIGSEVTEIESEAFFNCSKLAGIVIPDKVTSIGDAVFKNCTSLDSITIGGKVASIGSEAFKNCTSLDSITIGGKVASIGNEAFKNCTALKRVCFKDGGGVLSLGCNGEVQAIFYDAPLEEVYLGRNLEYGIYYIDGFSPFYGKKTLTSVVIGDSVTYIGENAFKSSNLTSITIPNSVTNIKDDAFSYCNSLRSITLPPSLRSIGNTTFESCSNLKEVHISDLAAWCNIHFENGYSNPLYCAEKLYLNGEGITDLVLPEGLTTIKSRTFYNYRALNSVKIPASVTSIEDYAFALCNNLESVTSLIDSENIFVIKNVFNEVDKANCLLFVPSGCKTSYASTKEWNTFANIIELEKGVVGDVNGDGNVDVADITSVVSVILNNLNISSADINCDGEINIADITTLVDLILKGK